MLSYKCYGDNGGIALVMVHGFLCGGEFFKPNITQIARQVDVITVDLPGFGLSDRHSGVSTIKEMAQQVLQTLSAIDCQRFYLLGHSMGGMVALQMALLANDRVIKLIAYATNSDGQLKERFETFAQSKKRLISQGLAHAKKQICATWFVKGEAATHFNLCLLSGGEISMDTALKGLDAMAVFNVTQDIGKINAPVLIISASEDKTYAPARLMKMKEKIKNAQFHQMAGCAHNAHLEKEDEFADQVLRFLT